MRSGGTSMILAFMWVVSVRKPAWLPVKDSASMPRSARAMHSRAVALRSPAVMSMSISRPGRVSETSRARRRSSSVSLPMAETTTTTSLPRRTVRATWSATARMRSGSATDVPPNFWTRSATGGNAIGRSQPLPNRGLASAAMASTPNRRQREAARQRSRAAAEARQASTRRRQRIIAVVIVAVVVLSIVGAVIGSRSSSTTSTATSTTTSVPVSTTNPDLPATGVAPEPAPTGEALTGATPCPAEDGSSPRVTLFAEAPPTCIDPTYFYVATIRTTKGDLSVQLNPTRAPATVNDVRGALPLPLLRRTAGHQRAHA